MCLAHSAYHVFITHNLSRTIYIGVSRSEHDKWRLLTHENTERRKVIHQTWRRSLQFCFTVHPVNMYTGLLCCGHISNSSDPSYQHGLILTPACKVITCPVKCMMTLIIHFQTSTVSRLKFGNGLVISSQTLWWTPILIHAVIKVEPC